MHEKAIKYVEDGDPETMAWAASCLYQGSWYGSMWGFDGKSRVEERPACELPEDAGERRRQFDCLDRALAVIGKREKVFHESVFPWMEKTLSAKPVVSCMMALAAYDMDEEMTAKLAKRLGYFGSDQRGIFFVYFMDPERKRDRQVLRENLNDRSSYNRGYILKLLGSTGLSEEDIEDVTELLSGKSDKNRRGIIKLLLDGEDCLEPALERLLSSENEGQNQAGLDMMREIREDRPKIFQRFYSLVEAMDEGRELSLQTEILRKQLIAEGDEVADREGAEEHCMANGLDLFDLEDACFQPGFSIGGDGEEGKEAPAEMPREAEVKSEKGLFGRLFGRMAKSDRKEPE